MKLGIVTAFPPSKVTLNEYGYYLAKNFVHLKELKQIYIYSDETEIAPKIDFDTQNKIIIRPCWKFNSYFSLFRIMQQILKDKPEMVLINGQFMKFGDKKIPAALGLTLGFGLKVFGIANIFILHNILEKVDLAKAGFTENKWRQWIYLFIGSLLTRIVLQSHKVAVTIEEYAEILQKKYHAKNIVVVPHGSFENIPLPEEQQFEEKVVMTFGKFGTYKKVEEMIEAVELIRKRKPELNIKILIAGTDNPNVKGYLEEVKKKYSQVKNLQFTGYVPEDFVSHLFHNSTVVVFPYQTTTGSSGVLHQAGSYAKATVLPLIDDLKYLIEKEGYRGEYFTLGNTESMSFAIEKIITNDAYRRELEIANFNASSAIPMSDVCRWYIHHFKQLLSIPYLNKSTNF